VNGIDAMIVVYDPSAGFVTGGGWINSPVGAFPANPSLVGKANVGFVSKYKKGATIPTGETEFQFKVANLNFHSTSYNWLVISGAKAQYKGSGTINGTGDYGFLLSAVDGQVSGGGGKDKFRIKITDKSTGSIVYDNQLGADEAATATTVLEGGSIAIQSSGGSLSAEAPATEESSMAPVASDGIFQNTPNPFNPETTIRFTLAEAGRAVLRVFNVRGELVNTLADEWLTSGEHVVRWNGRFASGAPAPSGVYYARVSGRSYRGQIRMILLK